MYIQLKLFNVKMAQNMGVSSSVQELSELQAATLVL